jgi:hypothetical protein
MVIALRIRLTGMKQKKDTVTKRPVLIGMFGHIPDMPFFMIIIIMLV